MIELLLKDVLECMSAIRMDDCFDSFTIIRILRSRRCNTPEGADQLFFLAIAYPTTGAAARSATMPLTT